MGKNSAKYMYWGKKIGLWALTILLALLFLLVGSGKLLAEEAWAARFAGWGLPVWLALVIGVVEMTGALLLLVPRTASYGSALIISVMLGASATHLFNGELPNSGFTLVLAALVFVVGYARRPAFLRREMAPAY